MKIVSALLLAVLSSLVCSLSQKEKKKKKEGGDREKTPFDKLQCMFEATGAANWLFSCFPWCKMTEIPPHGNFSQS